MSMNTLQFIRAILIAYVASVLPVVSKESPCQKTLRLWAREAERCDSLYQPGLCFSNAGELGRRLRITADRHLNLLVIHHRDRREFLQDRAEVSINLVPRWSGGFRLFNPKSSSLRIGERWKFHIVLESRRQIFDLDFNRRRMRTPLVDYWSEMFPELEFIDDKSGAGFLINRPEDFRVFRIPLDTYLNEFEKRPGLEAILKFMHTKFRTANPIPVKKLFH